MAEYRNLFTDAPIIKKPKTCCRRKIFTKSGAVIGALKNRNIHDLNGDFWGRIDRTQKDDDGNVLILNENGEQVGYIDSNKDIFAPDGSYYGTMNRRRFLVLLPSILAFLIAFAGFSMYLAGQYVGKVGIVLTASGDYPSFDVRQEDDGKGWNIVENLDVFRNPQHGNKTIIAPGSAGTYGFVVDNQDSSKMMYSVTMVDENNLKIPMRYRLKMDNAYILGNKDTWLDISEMHAEELVLPKNSMVIYTLEWMWDGEADHAADTRIGFGKAESYILNITISAEIAKNQ